MEQIVEVAELTKRYHQEVVLNIPLLTISRGERFGIVGNNGAGKTTFFRSLLDLIQPNSGRIALFGKNVTKDDDWKSRTGSFLEDGFLIPHLSPEEYFQFVASAKGMSAGDLQKQLKGFENLFNGEVLNRGKYIRDLSQGNRKKVGIAAALLGYPSLLILDEPFVSLDPSSQIILKTLLQEFQDATHATLLISSHNLNHIADVCTRIAIIHHGSIVRDEPKDQQTIRELEQFFLQQIHPTR